MSSIRLLGVTFAYPQQVSLIDECTVDFTVGWTGLVGRNGDGKSTLLDLIDGTLEPAAGSIQTNDLIIERCHQDPADRDSVETFANAWTPGALKWMSLLDLEPGDFWRWDELSPGMRRRWQIGAALYREPGALLLDEPTNHLDIEGRDLLVNALEQYRGVGLVVSHDRALLDALCDATVRLHRCRLHHYRGGYSAARKLWEAEAAAELAALEKLQSERRAVRQQLAQRAGEHASATRSLSSASRMKSIRDSDARSVARKGRAQRAEASLARGKAVARGQLVRLDAELEEMSRPQNVGAEVFVDAEQCPREFVIDFEAEVLSAGDLELATDVHVTVRRDGRHWLPGSNGCGKTTLLRAICETCDLPDGRLLYLPQQLDVAAIRAQFDAVSPVDRQNVLHIGAALGLDVRAVLDGTSLSPGETRKLAFSLGFAKNPWLVVLDEPTNDLDIEAIERLERALAELSGAMLVVTHDRAFAEALDVSPIPGLRFASSEGTAVR